MLAPSAATLPVGRVLIESYLFIDRAPGSDEFGSLSYLLYGLADRVTVGIIPTAGFNRVRDGMNSSGIGVGDVTLQAQYQLTQFRMGNWMPTSSLIIQQTLPAGKFDRLGNRPSDGFGGGAYVTTLALYSQSYFWHPNGRILRIRLDLSQQFPSSVAVQDGSVFGTHTGFRGNAASGKSSFIDASSNTAQRGIGYSPWMRPTAINKLRA